MIKNSSVALFPNVPPEIYDEAVKKSFVPFVDHAPAFLPPLVDRKRCVAWG
jgi:hypothetical protein